MFAAHAVVVRHNRREGALAALGPPSVRSRIDDLNVTFAATTLVWITALAVDGLLGIAGTGAVVLVVAGVATVIGVGLAVDNAVLRSSTVLLFEDRIVVGRPFRPDRTVARRDVARIEEPAHPLPDSPFVRKRHAPVLVTHAVDGYRSSAQPWRRSSRPAAARTRTRSTPASHCCGRGRQGRPCGPTPFATRRRTEDPPSTRPVVERVRPTPPGPGPRSRPQDTREHRGSCRTLVMR